MLHAGCEPNGWSGTVPEAYTQLPKLRELDLFSAGLAGPFPPDWTPTSLARLVTGGGEWGKGNNFQGPLPAKLPTSIKILQLDKSGFEGACLPPGAATAGQLPGGWQLSAGLQSCLGGAVEAAQPQPGNAGTPC